ncbi:MAG: fructose-1,6-bisphosphate aldolase [Microbacterium sp. 71-36]|uniref:class II fructose-bisphosphate aldolase n=1 Tax=unclassified Microbacterium TaxID=2609290 RepID=UPI00086F5703|nr:MULTISPECIES: class II fructose-bisphosphate aldolase [unclassified Microbacterium]MBN9212058.1 class II fructose-bisphosphate aldolase [Microbacterium sp.]ODT43071.1 MAG: fructose-1,6-bisphosphate aldolase [Microbacterium sp. SCN 71-17]ODU50469.1 MAG: fructose-1,6-bisphosphate aldolase [Microbacterium sp. SCN 70-10]OJV78050.1 MAG: fructose-1,6-bisphosphate aldolase [Microbacterium sp. 71-36]
MALVSGHEVVRECTARGLVAGAFNTTNIETTMGIVDAIERVGVPTFIQVAPTNVKLSGYEYIYDTVARRLADCPVPVALHLDHGKSLDAVEAALAADFTSIMIDASEEPFAENVAISARAREMCGADVALEAELGSIGGKEDDVAPEFASTTNPAQVAEFVAAVRCDMLAVSVGNVHGYAPNARIDFDLLSRVREQSSVPLVVHGGSGLPAGQLGRLAEFGVVKVNVASDLRNAMIRSFGEAYAANPNENSLIRVSLDAVAAITDVVERRIRMLNPSV